MQTPPFAGLCAECRHVKVIQSAKGSRFILCGLAKTDPRFPNILPYRFCAVTATRYRRKKNVERKA